MQNTSLFKAKSIMKLTCVCTNSKTALKQKRPYIAVKSFKKLPLLGSNQGVLVVVKSILYLVLLFYVTELYAFILIILCFVKNDLFFFVVVQNNLLL